jgi:LmeA-like phospholipid-binding
MRVFGDPLSLVLVMLIVVALGVAALVGGELYARHRATSVLKKAVECVSGDHASVSLGARPFLLQLMTGNFSDIVVETGGSQLGKAKGMKLHMEIADLRLPSPGNPHGTVGSLNAEISWSNNGIKQTLQDTVPVLRDLMIAVTTTPSDGTIQMQAGPSKITVRPQVTDGGLALQVLNFSNFGFTLPRESIQPQLDAFTSSATTNMPTGIHADSVQLTESGMTARFSARDTSIPVAQGDPCFANL